MAMNTKRNKNKRRIFLLMPSIFFYSSAKANTSLGKTQDLDASEPEQLLQYTSQVYQGILKGFAIEHKGVLVEKRELSEFLKDGVYERGDPIAFIVSRARPVLVGTYSQKKPLSYGTAYFYGISYGMLGRMHKSEKWGFHVSETNNLIDKECVFFSQDYVKTNREKENFYLLVGIRSIADAIPKPLDWLKKILPLALLSGFIRP